MNTLFYKSSRILNFLSVNFLSRITNQKIIYPFYHIISDDDVVHVKHLYKIRNAFEFEKDMDFLLKNFTPIDINTLLNGNANKAKTNKPAFLLSFDDGLREFYEVVAPILIKKGIPAINFLNPGFIENKDLFFRYKLSIIIDKLRYSNLSKAMLKTIELWFEQNKMKTEKDFNSLNDINFENRHLLDEIALLLEIDFQEYLKEHQPYMSYKQINSLIQQGFSFGAHSIDHPKYSDLNIDQQLFQTKRSIDDVVTNLDLKYKLFSFPFTDHGVSQSFFKTIYDNKPSSIDFSFGCAGLKKDAIEKNIQRIPIEIDQFTAKEVIYGEYLYYIFKSFFGKNTIKRN